MHVSVCLCMHAQKNTKRLFWNLLSKMGLLNNHPYTTLNIFFFLVNEKQNNTVYDTPWEAK